MRSDKLKQSAEEAKRSAQDFISSPEVQNVINHGKEAYEKGKDWIKNGQGKEYVEKGKQMAGSALDKLEDFVSDKTEGKGILGFGKKEEK